MQSVDVAASAAIRDDILAEIGLERVRQIVDEGHSLARDDDYRSAELVRAAVCYATTAAGYVLSFRGTPIIPHLWPWAPRWFKPKNRRADLLRSAALIVAELERMARADET